MKQNYKWWIAGVSTVVVLMTVAGFGTVSGQGNGESNTSVNSIGISQPKQNSTNNISTSTSSKTSASESGGSTGTDTQVSSPFPNIVNMAMKNFPANVLNGAEAPMVLPILDSGSNQMYYRTHDFTTGPILGYHVMLSSPHNLLADFSGSTYSGIPSGDAVRLPYAQGLVTSSNVHLSDGIVAKEHVFVVPGPNAKETSSNSLTWNEGRWQIEVTRTQDTKEPIAEADAVASYLHTHFMPVPQTKGAIFVNAYPVENAQGRLSGTSVNETITWQEGSHVYKVDTNSHVKKPIQTGLAMAISMEPFHKVSTVNKGAVVVRNIEAEPLGVLVILASEVHSPTSIVQYIRLSRGEGNHPPTLTFDLLGVTPGPGVVLNQDEDVWNQTLYSMEVRKQVNGLLVDVAFVGPPYTGAVVRAADSRYIGISLTGDVRSLASPSPNAPVPVWYLRDLLLAVYGRIKVQDVAAENCSFRLPPIT